MQRLFRTLPSAGQVLLPVASTARELPVDRKDEQPDSAGQRQQHKGQKRLGIACAGVAGAAGGGGA